MNVVNEKVEHIIFGTGVITEVKGNKIYVKFQDEIGIKVFLYPEVFEKIMKVFNPAVHEEVLEELNIKKEQIAIERIEKQREAAELEERKAELQLVKKKSTSKSTKKK
ncbi:hypothetical protein [Clostridium sp. BSD9I1]|uniref:hypothetical protein n=1 Tax=Clostridium sp. BSD9I1 TaxID=2003589 RepID=UPI001649746D|nr:hypothetical protein [Clostridium sp. BSD9I1]